MAKSQSSQGPTANKNYSNELNEFINKVIGQKDTLVEAIKKYPPDSWQERVSATHESFSENYIYGFIWWSRETQYVGWCKERGVIHYVDDAGRYADFHALRHSTGRPLAASGTHPKVAQSILRHSDINMMMSRYTHVYRGQESEAVKGLPDFSLPSKQGQKALATGTDNRPVSAVQNGSEKLTPELTPKLTPTAFSGCDGSATIGTGEGTAEGTDRKITRGHNWTDRGKLDNKNDGLSTNDIDKNLTERGGFEPPVPQGYNDFRDRPDQPLRHLSEFKRLKV